MTTSRPNNKTAFYTIDQLRKFNANQPVNQACLHKPVSYYNTLMNRITRCILHEMNLNINYYLLEVEGGDETIQVYFKRGTQPTICRILDFDYGDYHEAD